MNVMSSYRRRLMAGAYPKELPNYLCFTALEDGTFTFTYGSSVGTGASNATSISYSIDGVNWTTLNNVANQTVSITTPIIAAGSKVYWKGNNGRISTGESANQYSNFSSTGEFDVSGNVGSILWKSNFETSVPTGWYMYVLANLFRDSKVVGASDMSLLLNTGNSFNANNARYIYACMFMNCTHLISAPQIIDTFVGLNAYYRMFYGCISLAVPPILPKTTLTDGIYKEMFYDCTSLLSIPQLPATILTRGCYYGMFRGCTSLIDISSMNVNVKVAANCYQYMFYGCTSLKDVIKELSSNNLKESCYAQMFYGCTSFTTAPILPEETLFSNCYVQMFFNTKVNYIKALFLTAPSLNTTNAWLRNVPNVSTSIFVKHIDATWTDTGDYAIPSNWTILYYNPTTDKYYLSDKTTECDDHGNPI